MEWQKKDHGSKAPCLSEGALSRANRASCPKREAREEERRARRVCERHAGRGEPVASALASVPCSDAYDGDAALHPEGEFAHESQRALLATAPQVDGERVRRATAKRPGARLTNGLRAHRPVGGAC